MPNPSTTFDNISPRSTQRGREEERKNLFLRVFGFRDAPARPIDSRVGEVFYTFAP